mmetsp:Transcript_13346/g.27108  ORF Transcript_13346/g.27108 Transcript_13346/m.27108 type:complete len:102 (+) Transcript_13346:122-427(+)
MMVKISLSAKELELVCCRYPCLDFGMIQRITQFVGYTRDSSIIKWFWKRTVRDFGLGDFGHGLREHTGRRNRVGQVHHSKGWARFRENTFFAYLPWGSPPT